MIKLVTDSTSYLPADLLAQHDIHLVPLTLFLGTQAYREGVEIDTSQLFQKLTEGAPFPTTSRASPYEFTTVWQPLLDAGHRVLTILLSGRLSSMVDTARSAAQLLGNGASVQVLDSASIAMGLGMQVLRAAELVSDGYAEKAIVAVVERMRAALHVVFTLDTLEYVHRGGRINTAAAWVGTLLRVKPVLSLQKGVLEPLEQVRTTPRAVANLVERTLTYLGDDRRPWIAVMHSWLPSAAEDLVATLRDRYPEGRFFCSEIGPVLASHLGPGGVGIIACRSEALVV